jgi:hypothetical protein
MAEISSNGYKSGSRLERLLRAGHFVATGELGPPQSAEQQLYGCLLLVQGQLFFKKV